MRPTDRHGRGATRPGHRLRGGLAAGLLALGLASGAVPAARAQPAGDTATPRQLTEDEVYDIADHGLDLAEEGDYDAAYAALAEANAATLAHDYPLLTTHYPNLAFARYHYIRENWSEVQRFASSVASVLDKPGTENHPYRIEATILQGIALYETDRTGEAEVLLRGARADSADDPEMIDLNELAHYFLALAATRNEAGDQSDLRESFMARYTGDMLVTDAQMLYLLYLSLNAVSEDDEDPQALTEQSQLLVDLADTVEGVDEGYRTFYRAYHARLLYRAQRFDEALPYLRERQAYLEGTDNIGLDFAINTLRLANTLARTDGIAEATEFLAPMPDRMRASRWTPDYMLADVLTQLGLFARWQDDEPLAQDYFRQAYATARKSARATTDRVVTIAGLIDRDDPGMAAFAFAPELGVTGGADFTLSASGQDAIRMFMDGNYVALEQTLDAFARAGKDQSPEYLLNLAIYKALVGAYDESQDALAEARRKARTSLGSNIPANDPIFDLIDLIAKAWGTNHLSDRVGDPVARLKAREDSLPPDVKSLYLALAANAKYQSGQLAGLKADVERWMALQPADRSVPLSLFGEWATAIMAEMIFTFVSPEEGDAWAADALARLDQEDGLSLIRDTLQFTRVYNSPRLNSTDQAASEMGGLSGAIADQVPGNHSMIAATQYNTANAFAVRGQLDTALRWMQAATDTWRSHPFHRKDTLAFLVAQQANLLMNTGDSNLAATLAREAYDMIDPLQDRSDLAAGIITTLAYALRTRNDDASMGGEILKRHVDDAAFVRRLAPMDLVRLRVAYADMLANYAPIEEVLAQLDLATQAVPQDDGLDWRQDTSQIIMTRAIALYWEERNAEAWADVTRSNDIRNAWRRDVIADGEGEDLNAVDVKNRAVWEALIGWDFAATLPDQP